MSHNHDDDLGPDPNTVGQDTCLNDPTLLQDGGPGGSNGTAGTYCDLNRENNVWVEGVVDIPAGKRGICMLDTMNQAQVVAVLQHDPRARRDLPKVTSDADLLRLLATVPLLNTADYSSIETRQSARAGLPFYTLFAGRPPFAHPKK